MAIAINESNGEVEAMARALPPLTWFRAFECAARHLNFTAAADELGLTQSAVSQHVRSLEMRFGVPMFLRKPRGLALTDAGRRLLPYATKAISSLTAATAVFEPVRPDGVLTVATSLSFAQWYLAPRMSAFLDAHPGVQIRIRSTLWPDDFVLSDADVEIRFGSKELVGEGAAPFLEDRLIPVCAPKLSPGSLTWEEVRGLRLIQAVGTSDSWQSWAEHNGLDAPIEIAQLVDSYGLAVDLARCGAGVALTSAILAAPCLADGSLVVAFDRSAPARDGYHMAVRNRRSDATPELFSHWLSNEVKTCLSKIPSSLMSH